MYFPKRCFRYVYLHERKSKIVLTNFAEKFLNRDEFIISSVIKYKQALIYRCNTFFNREVTVIFYKPKKAAAV